MKWPKWEMRRLEIAAALEAFSKNVAPLSGISGAAELEAVSKQVVASLRREHYFAAIRKRGPIPASRADPHSDLFEAELGVVHLLQQRQVDEAAWLIFLMVYFAKPEISGWTRLRDVYGALGAGRWDWQTVTADPAAFTAWLAVNWQDVGGKFGNHRKYESLRPDADRPMGAAVERYVEWVEGGGGHARHFATMVRAAGNDPGVIFDYFYHALPIRGFGRLGRFDWVAMLARYDLIPAAAGKAYLKGATGPGYGARLLLDGDRKSGSSDADVQARLDVLDGVLGVGMEVLEDSLCNWQKRPALFVHFKG